MKGFANTGRFLLLTSIMLIIGACDIYYFHNGKWLMGVLFLLLFLLHFFLAFMDSGMFVEIGREGVFRRFMGRRTLDMKWHEIAEWGVVCPSLFPGIGKKLGTKYLYFSRSKMSEEERLDMCFHWPPKDKIYISYSPKRLHYVMRNNHDEPVYYNTEKAKFF